MVRQSCEILLFVLLLVASLRSVRQKQDGELRSIMNAPALGPPLDRLYLGSIKIQKNFEFIPKILEIQVDLSEMYVYIK